MPITDINHYLVRAADLEQTRQFYEDVLGFSQAPRPDFPFPGYWMGVNGGVQVHLAPANIDNRELYFLGTPADAANDNTGVIDHVAFVATDHAGLLARMREKNVPFRARFMADANLYQMFVTDPNGITIELNFHGVTEVSDLEGAEDYAKMVRSGQNQPQGV